MIVIATSPADAVATAAIAVARGWRHVVATADAPPSVEWDVAITEVSDRGVPDWMRTARSTAILGIGDADWIEGRDADLLGYDQVIDRARLSTDLPLAIADWCHAERMATIDRLATAFGDAAMARLLTGLRELLKHAATNDDDSAELAAEAHRIAGLAGTLGFSALGRAWARVEKHPRMRQTAARRATAHALETISRSGRL